MLLTWFRRRGAVAMLALATFLPASARAQASRVVSVNLCTDQLLLALADRGAIASVTYLARDCTISAHCNAAASVSINHGTAEELIAVQPDLVLGGRYTARPALEIAERIGLKVIELEPAKSLDMIRDQIREVAGALGQVRRGEAIVADLERRMAVPPPPAGARPVAAIYEPNGTTVGANSLIDVALEAAGYDDLARKLGIESYTYLPLETLIAYQPDLLILNQARAHFPSLAETVLRHPAIAAALDAQHRIVIPQSFWICGGPEIGDAVRLLADARARLASAANQ